MRTLCKPMGLFLAAAMTAAITAVPAEAAWISAADLVATQQAPARERLSQTLARDEVREQLRALGVKPEAVEKRLQGLTDEELDLLATRLEALPAGGDALGTVAVVLLILILLEIAGAIDIFPKI